MRTFLQRAHEQTVTTVSEAAEVSQVSEYAAQGEIRLDRPITDLAATPDGRTLVAIHFGDDAVSLIDTRTATVTATINDLYQPTLAGFAGRSAYVHTSAWQFDGVSVIDTDTARTVSTRAVESIVTALAVSQDGRIVYVGRTGDDGAEVGVTDTVTDWEAVVDLPTGPVASVDALQVSADGRRLYLAASDPFGAGLFVVDTAKNRVVRSMRLNAPIRDIALSPDGRVIYVLTCDDRRGGAVHTINTKVDRIAVTEEIGGYPTHFTMSADGARLYVVHEDRVSVLCTGTSTLVDAILLPAQPSGVAVSRNGARVYIADYDGVVTVLSMAGAMPEIVFDIAELDTDAARRELEPAGV